MTEGLCTLTELKTTWDINDLADAHDVLNLKEEAARKQARKDKAEAHGRT